MPDWITDLLGVQTAAIVMIVLGIGGALWKVIRWAKPYAKAAAAFLEDWNGEPERKDPNTGEVITPGKPSAPALLERMRHQVENSHKTALRDDLDVSIRLGKELTVQVSELSAKLDQHIDIAKESDRRLEALEREHRTN